MKHISSIYERPNLLQVDFIPPSSSNADKGTESFRCPHCLQNGSFYSVNGYRFHYAKKYGSQNNSFYASIRICPNSECRGIVFHVDGGSYLSSNTYELIMPPETIDFDATDIPTALLTTLTEAINCHAAGADRAAAMMVRRLLEEICDEAGATGKDLHHRLADLKGKITLPQALFNAMGELKALGNDAAHIQAKAFDNIGPEEAADSIELAKEILKALYQLDGLVKRLQARKKQAKPR